MSKFVSSLILKKFSLILKHAQARKTVGNVAMNLKTQNISVGTGSSVRLVHVSSARLGSAGEGFHRTSDFDKKILVWTKMYPNVAEVPDEVTNVKMKKAKDIFRIRVNIVMALTTIGLCFVYISSGKRAVERGESIHKQNRDRHFDFQKKD